MLISGCIFIFALEFTYHTLCCFLCCLVVKSCLTFATAWAVAHEALLSMEFPRQWYWTGLPLISLGDLPDPEIKSEFFCIGRWILYHWTTREAHTFCISFTFYVNLPFIFHITSENSTPHLWKKKKSQWNKKVQSLGIIMKIVVISLSHWSGLKLCYMDRVYGFAVEIS